MLCGHTDALTVTLLWQCSGYVLVCRSTDGSAAWHLYQQLLLYQRTDDG